MNRAELFRAFEATWPPARLERIGPFTYREGAGGGSRVSAATLEGALFDAALDDIEARFAQDARPALFQIRSGEDAFDAMLEQRGYRMFDPVACLTAPVERFAAPKPEDGYVGWPPTAIQCEIWAEGGITAARVDVMRRAPEPKCSLLGRLGDMPAGTAFVGLHGEIAVLHALEIARPARRQGLARAMMGLAADWARRNGATRLALQVNRDNTAALALYSSLGMEEAGHYHYRTNT
jgi:GNAT superfamily N-acetyltransferase